MVPYSGPHFQSNRVNDWPQAVALMPAGTWVKAIDNVQLLSEARAHNPGVKTVLRHFDGGWQQFDFVDHAARRAHARRFLESFVDGTFLEHAANVNAIEEYNEYNASSHNAADRQKRVLWVQAVCEEWSEFRNRDGRLAHIRLVAGNVAIGNDLPLEAARIIQEHEAIAGYHPYVPYRHPSRAMAPARLGPVDRRPTYQAVTASMRGGDVYHLDMGWERVPALLAMAPDIGPLGVLENEWLHLSGRWTVMDAAYRAAGITVQWLGTEGGPIGYYDWGGLDPMGGWRHPDVCAGDVGLYLEVLDYWTERANEWNARNGGRMLGQVLYNSGGTSEWQHFETRTPELRRIAELMHTYRPAPPPPPPPPPPPDPEPEPRRYHRTVHLLPQDARPDELGAVVQAAYTQRQTVLFSVDDAFCKPPEVTGRTVYIWEVGRIAGSEQALRDWVGLHYAPWPVTSQFRRISELFVADVWSSPVGNQAQRDGDQLWPEGWVDVNPYLNHYDLGYHTGADLNNNSVVFDYDRNMPVYAAASGRVTYAGIPSQSWQRVVVIEHVAPDGSVAYSRYGHLGDIIINDDQWVRREQMIGIVGRNMTSSGAGPFHLHFDISPTRVLLDRPADWPGEDRARVVRDYVEPRGWIAERRARGGNDA